jgi:hypothetical protein
MVDEELQGVSDGPAGAPINRDARPDPGGIEGGIAAREIGENESSPGPTTIERGTEPRAAPAARPPGGARGFLGGAVAGLIVSALAVGAGYTLLPSKADVSEDANRLSEIEAQVRRDNSALTADLSRDRAGLASLEKRLSSLEARGQALGATELEKRVAALEAASAENKPNAAAAAETTQRLATQVKGLQGDVEGARGEIPDLSARVAKLESEPKTNAAGSDLVALATRLDKVEAALATPKIEARAAPEAPSPADNAAPIAIIAEAIADKLGAGAPFGPELAALEHLGVDPAKLAALKVEADGATTGAALAASFNAVAPKVLAAVSTPEQAAIADRFLAHVRSLVRVRDLNETAGDDPPALVSQIEAMSRRGDVAGALGAFNKLPEAARQAAGDWPAQARARQAADSALQSIREAAIGRLAAGTKP